jgi:exodeoxyribonuclease VII large subunit
MEQVLQEKRHRMEMYASMLEGNSPLKKLSGGYAFLTKESGERVHGVAQLTTGDVIRAHMLDGSLVACVKEVNME